jgi:hypothetical protein
MAKCKFCGGEGQIIVLEYAIRGENPYFVHKAYLKETILGDCPKCNGSGQAIE